MSRLMRRPGIGAGLAALLALNGSQRSRSFQRWGPRHVRNKGMPRPFLP
jgi:hypothetical protein